MPSRSDTRLRFWALCQYAYHLVTEPRDEDAKRMRAELAATAIARGHLCPQCFYGLDGIDAGLGLPEVRGDDARVIAAAEKQLRQYRVMPVSKSGVLRRYAAAQLRHLARCERCRAEVCRIVREDVTEHAKITRLFRSAGMGLAARTGNGPPN